VPHYVRRARLLGLLDEVVAAPLTLVVAPAGTGKTTLLAGWAAEAASPVGWLSLDDGDADAARLEAGICAAVATLAPGPRRAGTPPTPSTVAELLDGAEGSAGSPAVLVIDDAHVVDAGPAAAELLAGVLRNLPPWLHVVVASRRELALPLDRLRGRGQVGEIRFTELRFTDDEARDLLSGLEPSLSGEQVAAVVERVGGWAAILELAALAARSARATNEAFLPAAGDALARDYLMAEVLAAEAPELVEAMADLAVVPQAGSSLAKALTGRADAVDLLRRAEARGLFVSRLPQPGRFEVHPPVRAALLAEQAATDPDRLAERHARAARWYEDMGEAVAALDHWLRAGRPRQALALLASQHATLYDRGEDEVVRRTIAAIPHDVADADLASMIDHAWCHLLVDPHAYLDLVDKVTWWGGRSGPPGPPEHLGRRIAVLRAIAAMVAGRSADGGRLARQAVAELGEDAWHDPLGRFGWNVAAREVALSERWSGDLDDVRQAELALGRDPERRLTLEGTRALGEALAGRPVDALRVVASVRQVAAAANTTILRYELRLAEALAHIELGERAEALPQLAALATTPAGTMLFCQVLAAAQLVQAHLEAGEVAEARAALDRAEALVADESFGPDGRAWLARAGARVALAEGAVGRARAYADQLDDPFWGPVSGARVDLAVGARAEANAALLAAVPRSPRHEVVRALLLARAATGHEEAVRWVTAAVQRAVDVGQLQTVAGEGAEVVQLVERAAWRAPEGWMNRLRRAAVPSARQLDDGGAVESLTARERDVLRLLAGRLTVREIASELYVSPNTLKFHLKTIYRKLGVGSRAEAADVARRMTTIQPQALR
jgi:LuxR family maltose regulon positive regulatory protein